MADDKPTATLPTELISEKTFYTLGGASAAVLLVCWVIEYVAPDASWIDFKAYRLIGIVLSEVFAVMIMYKTRKKGATKWLFAFLNGLLIFVNASGLNTMMASSVFDNPPDSAAQKKNAYFPQQQPGDNKHLRAAIFSLPRMVNWWPDEKLVSGYKDLQQENTKLATENNDLKYVLTADNEAAKTLLAKNDSLQRVIISMQTVIDERHIEIEKLTETIKGGNADLSGKLAECLKDRDKINSELTACRLSEKQLTATVGNLNRDIARLKEQLQSCQAKSPTLAQLLQQVCNRMSRPERIDRNLMQQDFYKKIDWKGFCRSFNVWNNPIE